MAVGIITVYKVLRVYMEEIQTTMKFRSLNLSCVFLSNFRIASHNFGKGPI